MPLPEFVEPMLATSGPPFDSDEHLFEVKWDGTRMLAFVEDDACRLVNRRRREGTMRYPELSFLAGLPAGTVLDGEVVVLGADGHPEFSGMLKREQARTADRARRLAAEAPATYVVFDLLYEGFERRFDVPLAERRELLRDVLARLRSPHLIVSDGVTGTGIAFFEQICARGFEGVVAKRLKGRYEPGRRTGSWTKIKPVHRAPCAIVGFVPEGERDFKSLAVAMPDDAAGGALTYVGNVGSGLTEAHRAELRKLLFARLAAAPIVPCDTPSARWVEPGLFCFVKYTERTAAGHLRAPVFAGMVDEESL